MIFGSKRDVRYASEFRALLIPQRHYWIEARRFLCRPDAEGQATRAAETYSIARAALFPAGDDVAHGLDGKVRVVALGCLAHSRRLMGRPTEAGRFYERVATGCDSLRDYGSLGITRLQQGMAELVLGRLATCRPLLP
jgi:hypothetical protein